MTLQVSTAAFLEGYQVARTLQGTADPSALVAELAELAMPRRPFAFEGAAMAWELRDAEDGSGRTAGLVEHAAREWRPFLLLGIGCAAARLGRPVPSDPMAADGFGFQLGLWRGVSGLGAPTSSPDAVRGRGRALWFVTGGDGAACAAAIRRANADEGELWRGIGTACAFAGDPRGHAERLPELAGPWAAELSIGVEQALALWTSLGEVPARVRVVGSAVGGVETNRARSDRHSERIS